MMVLIVMVRTELEILTFLFLNCRFQILRDLIPQNDQKRDKASFLLEVTVCYIMLLYNKNFIVMIYVMCFLCMQLIEYVQFLQEKINMYEGSYQGWNSEPTKLVPWVKFYCLTCLYERA